MFGRFSYQKYTSEPERAPLESNLIATNDSPFLGLAFNWTRTLGATTVNELLVGFTHVKFETIPIDWAGIGDANATIGIPGGQAIPGLSTFNISGDVGFGSTGGSEFNDIKTYQVTEKFSWFKGRHSMKFGGRWLFQNQGFAYSGNEGILGHFNYSGTFTGFGFSDFLLDQVSQKGRGGLVEPFTHLGHRVGIYAQDDFHVRHNLTLNLGLTWEYTSPWVEKDDRQSNIDLRTGQLLLAGQNGNSRALYDRLLRRLGAAPRLRLDADRRLGRSRRIRDRAVHGGHREESAAPGQPAVQLRGSAIVRLDDGARDSLGRLRRHRPDTSTAAREPCIGSSLPICGRSSRSSGTSSSSAS